MTQGQKKGALFDLWDRDRDGRVNWCALVAGMNSVGGAVNDRPPLQARAGGRDAGAVPGGLYQADRGAGRL